MGFDRLFDQNVRGTFDFFSSWSKLSIDVQITYLRSFSGECIVGYLGSQILFLSGDTYTVSQKTHQLSFFSLTFTYFTCFICFEIAAAEMSRNIKCFLGRPLVALPLVALQRAGFIALPYT